MSISTLRLRETFAWRFIYSELFPVSAGVWSHHPAGVDPRSRRLGHQATSLHRTMTLAKLRQRMCIIAFNQLFKGTISRESADKSGTTKPEMIRSNTNVQSQHKFELTNTPDL